MTLATTAVAKLSVNETTVALTVCESASEAVAGVAVGGKATGLAVVVISRDLGAVVFSDCSIDAGVVVETTTAGGSVGTGVGSAVEM